LDHQVWPRETAKVTSGQVAADVASFSS
jgi:hypothetical protein